MESGIRPPAVAGSFYPSEKTGLRSYLVDFFAPAKRIIPGHKAVRALIVPHAGYVYSGATAAWGFAQLPGNPNGPHFVLIGPSHRFGFDGLTGTTAGLWQTPLGQITQLPPSPVKDLVYTNDPVHLHEHSLEVQLPFLQYLYPKGFSVTCFLTGQQLDAKKTSAWLLKHYPESIFIFSSDLSHYLPRPEAQKKDTQTIRAILDGNSQYFLKEDNVACGAAGILLALQMAKLQAWQPKLVYYDTSATASGDNSAVVGYAAVALYD
jgi:AmmeMemoRadiSam system protein B